MPQLRARLRPRINTEKPDYQELIAGFRVTDEIELTVVVADRNDLPQHAEYPSQSD